MLLFGIVMYAAGKLGQEPVRSQGHVHRISPHCGWSTPELFEVWEGRAIVFAQQKSGDDPGRCFAIEARSGDRVAIPPGWAHYVANGDPNSHLIFAAWCDRQYGFDYDQMRTHGGLAWFPLMGSGGKVEWTANRNYSFSRLEQRAARAYPELGLSLDMPIYEHLRQAPESIQWISDPARLRNVWPHFEP
jgi:glucose-6-phosphate isomerase